MRITQWVLADQLASPAGQTPLPRGTSLYTAGTRYSCPKTTSPPTSNLHPAATAMSGRSLLAVLLHAWLVSALQTQTHGDSHVQLDGALVVGTAEGLTESFLGIPYAHAP